MMHRQFGVWLVMGALVTAGLGLTRAGARQSGGQANPQSGVIRREVDLVAVYFTVRDSKKHLVPTLRREQFRVYEDGHEQPLEYFSHQSDVPLDLGVLLDTGTNMSRILSLEAEASSLFVRRVLRKNDLAFVVSYDSHVTTVQVPTADVAQLQEQVGAIGRSGKGNFGGAPRPQSGGPLGGGPVGMPHTDYREARLYDAVRISVHRYLAREVGRKAVVIVALSDDAKSESTLEDALEALQQSDVIAYVLQMHDGPHDFCDVRHIYAADKLKKLAEETGGRVIDVRGMDKMQVAFDEIAEELHSQYSLGYHPENTNWNGKYRKIQITAKDGGYKIYARKGYYANPRSASN